jgi:hypothetical protein
MIIKKATRVYSIIDTPGLWIEFIDNQDLKYGAVFYVKGGVKPPFKEMISKIKATMFGVHNSWVVIHDDLTDEE